MLRSAELSTLPTVSVSVVLNEFHAKASMQGLEKMLRGAVQLLNQLIANSYEKIFISMNTNPFGVGLSSVKKDFGGGNSSRNDL